MKDKLKSSGKMSTREISGWEGAARHARRQIEQAKARIASLEQSLRIINQKIRDGEPWPEEVSATQN